MAEMFQPKKQTLKKSDYNKAVIKASDKLKAKNKSLESSLKDKEKELKSLDKECSSESRKMGKLLKDITFQEDRFQKLKGAIYSNEKLLSEKLKKVGVAESELCDYEIGVEKLEERERKLLDTIASLEFYKSKCSDSKVELAGIQAKKDSALDELSAVENDISNIIAEGKKKIVYYEDQYEGLEEKAKKHEDMVHQFEQRLFETEDQFKEEKSKFDELRSKYEKEKQKINDELQAIKNLVGDAEDEYIKWEQKIAKAKAVTDKEVERNKNAKDQFKRWKIGVLEEVARLKLKSKVEKIDKAGLSDILNG